VAKQDEGGKERVRAGRRTVEVSRPSKTLFPGGATKLDLVDYYLGVSGAMLPHIRDRLMTLERFPDGIDSQRVFTKSIPGYFPGWIDRTTVPKAGGTVTHVVCNDKSALAYLAAQACITMHVGLSRTTDMDHPDQMVFDLDPATEDVGVLRSVARDIGGLLDDLGLRPVLKTSGSKGLHVTVPLDGKAHFGEVRAFARDLARLVADRRPVEVTVEQRKEKRRGRLFLDWLRNSFGATVVAPWTVRARPGAPVAVPITWEELDARGFHPQRFSMKDALERASDGDPWTGWRRRARSLGSARSRLDALID
jgi:bifunctional non-homologous end joining protein LigD